MRRVLQLAAAGAVLLPGLASADILTVWAAGKADYVGGTSDLYDKFDGAWGGGVAGGVEVIGIDVWGEALIFGTDQYLFTTNVGLDLTFGEETRFTLGAFLSPMFFVFPKGSDTSSGLDFSALSDEEQRQIEDSGISLAELSDDYVEVSEKYTKDSDRVAVGLGLPRVQLQVEQHLGGPLYLGIGGEVAYTLILSGEAAAADAKADAIDNVAEEKGLRGGVVESLKEAAGAKKTNTGDLDGVSWNIGAFLKIEL